MLSRRLIALIAVAGAVACSIDAALEGPQGPTPVPIALSLAATSLAVAPGDSATLSVSAVRTDGSRGKVTFALTVPANFEAIVAAPATDADTTTAIITIRAGASVKPGTYFVTVKAAAEPAGGANVPLVLNVAPHPGITLTPMRQVVAAIPSGIVPLVVSVARTGVTDSVRFTLVAPQGITLVSQAPLGGPTGTITLAMSTDLAPGTYPVTLRASAPGVPDSDAQISVVVGSDPLQLIVGDVTTVQASVAQLNVIVNRNGTTGDVALTADGLPAGVTLSAAPTGGTTATAQLVVAASAPAGTYTVALHATGSTGATASTTFALSLAASNVAMTLVPQNIIALQGSSAASLLTLVRTAFDGAVSVELTGAPTGITVAATDATITGATTTIVATVAKNVSPGAYTVGVRAVPLPTNGTGSPALDPVTAPLVVTVVEAPTTDGNVILDWSRCTTPDWVAGQDGSGPWARLAGVQGRFRFDVSSVRGSIAYSTGPTALAVRTATNAELTAAPIDMCDPVGPQETLRTVTGIAQGPSQYANGLPFAWHFGGGVGGSTVDAPLFTMFDVRPGTHDLVGVSLTSVTALVLVRDLTPSASGSIGTIPVIGQFSFSAILGGVRVIGATAERLAITESYLTTVACTPNDIFTTRAASPVTGSVTFTQIGVPAQLQRATDFHRIEVIATSGTGTRVVSKSFHLLDADVTPSIQLPPNVPTFSIVTLPGTHQRLRLSMDQAPVGYAGDVTLRFNDGQAQVTVSTSTASLASAGSGIFLLDMPDLGGIGGFPTGAVPRAGSHGTWTLSLSGSSGEAKGCGEGASRWSNTRAGTF